MIPEDRVTLRRIVWFCLCVIPFSLLIGAGLPFAFWGCSVSQHFVAGKLPKAWRTNSISHHEKAQP